MGPGKPDGAGVRSEGLEKGRCQDRPSARPYLRVTLSPRSPILGELSTCLKPFQVTSSPGTASSCKALRWAGCWRGLRTLKQGAQVVRGQAHQGRLIEDGAVSGDGHKGTGLRHAEVRRPLEPNQGEQQGEQGVDMCSHSRQQSCRPLKSNHIHPVT